MAFQLQEIGGMFSPVVLIPVWVNDELRFIAVPMYLLSIPLPPNFGPMRLSIYFGLNEDVNLSLTEYVDEMVPNF